MIAYYCCTNEKNNCSKKENCMRFINAANEPHTTLFKYACTEDNDYLLYITNKTIETEFNNKNDFERKSENNKEGEGN